MISKKDSTSLPLSDFTFTQTDKLILRQFEWGAEPCLKLSKFYQINDATSHETIFVTKAYISMLSDTVFAMLDEKFCVSSHHEETDEEFGRNDESMHPCIESFRQLYADDMAFRCGLTESRGGCPAFKLPVDCAIALLLNPLYGGKSCSLFEYQWQCHALTSSFNFLQGKSGL